MSHNHFRAARLYVSQRKEKKRKEKTAEQTAAWRELPPVSGILFLENARSSPAASHQGAVLLKKKKPTDKSPAVVQETQSVVK